MVGLEDTEERKNPAGGGDRGVLVYTCCTGRPVLVSGGCRAAVGSVLDSPEYTLRAERQLRHSCADGGAYGV